MIVLTVEQMKRAEMLTDTIGLSYKDMMKNAGLMAYKYVYSNYEIKQKECVVLCGNGNNAGDGFIVAARLAESGSKVSVIMCSGTPKTAESMEMFQHICGLNVEIIDISSGDGLQIKKAATKISSSYIIIDAVFGTGFCGELTDVLKTLFNIVNAACDNIISLDVPSGVNADTAECGLSCIKPSVTLVFAARKPVHTVANAEDICGKIAVLNIGIPEDVLRMVMDNVVLLNSDLIKKQLPKRNPKAHKGDFGKLINVSGSARMCGAAMMSTLAAMRSGAGRTTLASAKCVTATCAPHMMEAMTFPMEQTREGTIAAKNLEIIGAEINSSSVCLLGCGLSVSDDIKTLVNYIIENAECALVIDADALNCISINIDILSKIKVPAVITPHVGEMSRLMGLSIEQVLENFVDNAREFAKKYNITVVLKGHNTIVATPKGDIFENTTGNVGLAKGGSGDVLAGMIASFVAQGMSTESAAVCGVYLHGMAADFLAETMSTYSMMARDVIDAIPVVIKKLGR